MLKHRIIGFAGRAFSGKTEFANSVNKEFGGVRLSFAKYLKQLCCDLVGCSSIEELNSFKKLGESKVFVIEKHWLPMISEQTGISTDIVSRELNGITEFMGVRNLLQFIGTDLIRKYKPTWHIDKLKEEVKSLGENIVITIDDVRFENELEAIRELGGRVIYVLRPSTLYMTSNHISETSLNYTMFDRGDVIINRYALEITTTDLISNLSGLSTYDDVIYDLSFLSNEPLPRYYETGFKDINELFCTKQHKYDLEVVKKVLNENKQLEGNNDISKMSDPRVIVNVNDIGSFLRILEPFYINVIGSHSDIPIRSRSTNDEFEFILNDLYLVEFLRNLID